MYRLICIAGLLTIATSAAAGAPQTAVLDVQNMTCETCPITVKKALQKVPGVAAVTVDYQHKSATVTFDPDKTTIAALTQATTNAGYPSALHP